MSAYFSMQDYLRNTQHLAVESRRSSQWSMDDDDSSILDDNILETSADSKALDLSNMDQRRTSFVDAAVFSPVQGNHEWDFEQELNGMQSPLTSGNNAFVNGSVKMEAQFSVPGWGSSDRSGSATPTPQAQNFPQLDFDALNFSNFTTPTFEAAVPHQVPSNVAITPVSIFPGSSAPVAAAPISEQSKEWQASPAPAVSEQSESNNSNSTLPSNNGNKRMRPETPMHRPSSPIQIRRDGIRKKNARFEIPPERTLMNIDHLITQSTDEAEIRVLKQQKRLLRNRQAALDSRQRKKQHTERLEEEKKMHSHIIAELEERNAVLEVKEQEWMKKEQEWYAEREMMQHYISNTQMQSEEMVRNHTLESGELRKKNAYLARELDEMREKLERASLNANTPSGSLSDDFNFDSMHMDAFWEAPAFPEGSDMVPDAPEEPETKEIKVPGVSKDDGKPANGLLFLLLLFGAFVASKASTNSALPPIPQPLKSASAVVLNTIFEDAGVKVNGATAEVSGPTGVQSAAGPAVSQRVSESWVVAKSNQMIGLDSVLGGLDLPTQAQEDAQLKMLTAAEYQEITSKDFLREQGPVGSAGRRHLQEGLAALRGGNSRPSAAEVYTRSLLWDKVDAEVVRRFAAFAQQAAASESNDAPPGDFGIEAM